MKHSILLGSTVLALGLPVAAHATCERYMNSTLTLNLPATITVPNNLPIGGEIISSAFSGTAPAFFTNCYYPHLSIKGRYHATYPDNRYIYLTEASGVGVRLRITDARGITNFYGMFSQEGPSPTFGSTPSFTAAQLTFFKIGPAPAGEVPAGDIWSDKRDRRPEGFTLRLGNTVRFVTPAATCDLATGDVNRTVSLDPIKVSAFQNTPFAGTRPFELTAICSNAANVSFRFSGTPAPGNDLLFANTGTAADVALWLYSRINGIDQTLPANGSDNTRTLVVSGDRAVLPLGAAYHQNGTVGPGTLVSTATVNITYN